MIALGKQRPLNTFFVVNIKNLIFLTLDATEPYKLFLNFIGTNFSALWFVFFYLDGFDSYNLNSLVETPRFR